MNKRYSYLLAQLVGLLIAAGFFYKIDQARINDNYLDAVGFAILGVYFSVLVPIIVYLELASN